MRNPHPPIHFVIKKGIEGTGAFSTEEFKKGDILFKLKGPISNVPTRTSIQIGKNKHIEDEIGVHVNHSCHPNAKLNKKTLNFVSIKNIKKDEEITFNYNENEDELASPFICKCCGTKIRGKKYAHADNNLA